MYINLASFQPITSYNLFKILIFIYLYVFYILNYTNGYPHQLTVNPQNTVILYNGQYYRYLSFITCIWWSKWPAMIYASALVVK
jgi:uncharacterized membrane protein (DUF106 family)